MVSGERGGPAAAGRAGSISLPGSPQAPAREAFGDFLGQRQLWRERTLQGLLASMFGAMAFASLWFSLIPYGVAGMTRSLIGATLVLGVLAFAGRGLPFTLRAILCLVGVFAASLTSTLSIGFSPNALVGFVAVAVATALLFGRGVALCVVGVGCITILGLSLAHSSGWIQQASNWPAILDSSRIPNGLRVMGVFALLATSTVLGVSYLLERTEHVLLQQVEALQALQREQLEKEKLRADLALRENELHKARELETLGRLAGSMAHDFNNALLVIWAAVEDLSEQDGSSDVRAAALSALRAAAEQATATTRSLRAFGPGAPRRPTLLPLTGMLGRARASLARILPPNIAVETELQLEASVAADEGELLRVLTNLALNARDAMRDGGKLILRLRALSESERANARAGTHWVVLEVADTGAGMSEAVKERLFEPFFTTKELGGTGLGLATVRELMRKNGGDVVVASELGHGTTVTLFWPVASASTASLLSPAFRPSGAGQVVLVVDDDPAVLAALTKSLSHAGFSVLEAANAALAIETLRRGKLTVHALCTDWMMPGRPVRELIEEFRRSHAGPVLICSGYAPAETGISLELADDFLPKPFKGDDLVRKLCELLLKRASLRAAAQ